MTQTPLEAEEAAGTVAAGADLEAPSPAPAEAKSYRAEPWTDADGVLADPPPGADVDAVELRAGPVSARARLVHTPAGLLAAGALVGIILLTTAVIVGVATAPARRHPLATAWTLRRR
jgi:hypothetical protein